MNFKTTQQANEKALCDLLKSKNASPDVKQTLQARAAIYGEMLEPAWFVRNSDLSSKLKSINDRRTARSMLIGAVLLVAQLGAYKIRSLLTAGENEILQGVPRKTRGTLGHLREALSRASPLAILKETKKAEADILIQELLRHADDLDYLQVLISSLAKRGEINPSLNAVIDAHNRRRFNGRFREHGQSVELDTIIHQGTKGTEDDDTVVQQKASQPRGFSKERLCYAFQKGECSFASCRYRHRCAICDATSHGAISCEKKKKTSSGEGKKKTKPPHPRFRRDRALDS